MITKALMRPYGQALVPPYLDYCATVSPVNMVISHQTATLFAFACVAVKAKRVLDLGSGFTSYVARCMATDCVSVDDSPEWLDRTGAFLADNGLPTDGLMLWDDWKQDPGGPYDVVFHDFASGGLRESSMWDAAAVLGPHGIVIFDDANHDGHRAVMLDVAARHGFRLVDVRDVTFDAFERWALMAVRP